MKKYFCILMWIYLPLVVEAQQRPPAGRDVALSGAVNFRDLGGYATTDYRRTAMGRIYRAGDISRLTDADMETMKRRRIYTAIDFRGEEEAAAAPDRLLPGADYLLLPAGSGNSADLAAFIGDDTIGVTVMRAYYADVSAFRERYRPFFRKLLLLPDTSAVVFHCAAGKDRTGIAAALLLYVLDVPMETIISDYVLTNYYRREHNEKMIEWMVNQQGIDRHMAAELMDANPIYLESMFNALKKQYGSVDSFLYRELGINEAVKLRLREKFLQ